MSNPFLHQARFTHLAIRGAAAILLVAVSASRRLDACPFCFGSLQLTLREQIETADATVVIRWKSGDPGDLNQQRPASTRFEVIEVLRGELAAGDAITIDRYQLGRAGDVFLMSGNEREQTLDWDRSVPLSKEGLAYLRDLPSASAPTGEKLRYALRFLESDDDTVATDAFTVVGGARYEDIAAVKDAFPADKLRLWLFDADKLKGQRGVYGMLLGLCGDDSDRRQLERLILDTQGPDDFRLGIAGVMGGYLLIARSDGLELLEREFLTNPDASSSDRAATMEALRFIGKYAEDRITKDQLSRSVRKSLMVTDQPELPIADLARWQDWGAAEQLIEWYGQPNCDKYIRKAIINFMLVASQADRSGLPAEELRSLDAASQFVETLRKEQPKLYERASRAFIPRS